MEVFLYTTISFCLFVLGISLGGILEHRRAGLLRKIEESRRSAIETIAPALERIEQNTGEQLRIIQGTLVGINSGGAATSGSGCSPQGPDSPGSPEDAGEAAPEEPEEAHNESTGHQSAP